MERKEKETNLQKEFAKAKQLLDSDPNATNANALNSAKEKLELLYEEKLQGIIIRARARWWEQGEKSTKYFLNLEKKKISDILIYLINEPPLQHFSQSP